MPFDNTVMRVNNKRKHAHQMRANARVRTRFSTRVYAKIVRAFCVCVGRLSLTCTVLFFTGQRLAELPVSKANLIRVKVEIS